MKNIDWKKKESSYSMVGPTSQEGLELVSGWYLKEWDIPFEKTKELMSKLRVDGRGPLQVVMFLDNEPMAAGGFYNQTDLFNLDPEYTQDAPWFMVIYVKDEFRKDGTGAILSTMILERAYESGDLNQKEISVFTHEDDASYKKLAWSKLTPFNFNKKIVFGYKKLVLLDKAT